MPDAGVRLVDAGDVTMDSNRGRRESGRKQVVVLMTPDLVAAIAETRRGWTRNEIICRVMTYFTEECDERERQKIMMSGRRVRATKATRD